MKKILVLAAGFVSAVVSASAYASDAVSAAATSDGSSFGIKATLAIAAGLGIAIAAFGGALGQGKVASAAMDGIARNPEATGKLITPMIIALAIIESLVIYALVIAFLLQGKI